MDDSYKFTLMSSGVNNAMDIKTDADAATPPDIETIRMVCNTRTAKYYTETITGAHSDFYKSASGTAFYDFHCKNPADATATGAKALAGSLTAFIALLAFQ